ncbi:MAG: hypothetical protein DME85_00975 [Verrucomicrobia bacterium]|nr:MAG: hypothetical protein DME85_00975 [Verrucomicrobiota bacterium]
MYIEKSRRHQKASLPASVTLSAQPAVKSTVRSKPPRIAYSLATSKRKMRSILGKLNQRFELPGWRGPIAPIVIPVGAWHCESRNVFTDSKLRTSALSKFVTLLSRRFVSNKRRTQTE